MSDFNFTIKEGDFVYIPSAYCTAQKVKSEKGTNLFKADCFTFFDSGYLFGRTNPAGKIVFPATQEWYDKLVCIYPKLEAPPKRKEPREVIEAMLESGYHGVPCKTECGRDRYICTGIVEDEFYSFQYDNDDAQLLSNLLAQIGYKSTDVELQEMQKQATFLDLTKNDFLDEIREKFNQEKPTIRMATLTIPHDNS